MIEFKAPETTTVIRWCLRLVLVMFLAWLVKRKPDQDEDDEEENEEEQQAARQVAMRQQRPQSRQQLSRLPRPRDPYAANSNPNMRQRRPMQETTDFDSVIEKMSKPKENWEIRKDGGPAVRKPPPAANPSTSLAGLQSLVTDSMDAAPAVRQPLKLASKRNQPNEDGSEPAWKKDLKMTLHAHERPVTCITFNQDGNLLFTCGKDKRVFVWSFPDNEQLGLYGSQRRRLGL